MNVTCFPGRLSGTIRAIPSKSDAHRKLICAALSENGGLIPLYAPFCDDIAATVRCLKALGAGFAETETGLQIMPVQRQAYAALDCGESGSTLRFLLPAAMCVCGKISVTGSGRLPERPIRTLTDAMTAHGVRFHGTSLPLTAEGALHGGCYEIPGNISSQFLSGLLMALPFCDTDSEIRLTTPLQSAAYVGMTLDTLRLFGAEIAVRRDGERFSYFIKGKQKLHFPDEISMDGDWSNAAFWLTAGALQQGGGVSVSGLSRASVQGDRAILPLLCDAGAGCTGQGDTVGTFGSELRSFDVSMEEIPDLLPILAVRAACAAEGVSHFVHAERLRLKESDRLTATAELLRSLGGKADELPDGLSVYGGTLRGGTVDAKNDHRLVMAAAIAALKCELPVTILGAEAVNKSYPAFFTDYCALGGRIQRED